MRQTILLVSSDHPYAARLRVALAACPTLAVGGDVRTGADAVRLAARDHPEAIVLAADLPGRLLVPLVRDLRAASDASRIVVIGDLAALDGDTVGFLLDLGIAACLLWSEVRPEALPPHVATVLDSETLVISRGLLERRQGPRIASLTLTTRERGAPQGGAAGDGAPGGTRVTLWMDDPEIADSLRFYAAEAGLRLNVVDTADALRAALPCSDVLVVDCATLAGALERRQAIVPHTALPVLICYPDEGFVDDLRSIAGGELTWLPPEWLGSRMRDKLRLLATSPNAVSGAAPGGAPPLSLTPRQQQVSALKAAGHSTRAIADMLGISTSTVKSHIAQVLGKREDAAGDGAGRG